MSNAVLESGRMITSSTTGSIVALVGSSCKLLGFFAGATTTLSVYDSATAAAAGASNLQGFAISACAVGWNRLPLDLNNGLCVNQGAQLNFVVAG